MKNNERPISLYVDLDGTLLRTDVFGESMIQASRYSFMNGWRLMKAFVAGGLGEMKGEAWRCGHLSPADLPYNYAIIEAIYRAKNDGRHVFLATAAHEEAATAIARHLNLFDGVLASTRKNNLSGKVKRDAILRHASGGSFEYIGNEKKDRLIWSAADRSSVVASSERAAIMLLPSDHSLGDWYHNGRSHSWRSVATLLRVHQWIKNLLLFLPLLVAVQPVTLLMFGHAFAAFLSWSLLASSIYIFNDLVDTPADRTHDRKKSRPIASGALSLKFAIGLAAIAIITSAIVASLWLPGSFFYFYFGYVLLNVLYTYSLKAIPILDIGVLVCFYLIRIIAGGVVVSIAPSFWLLVFSFFIFSSIAVMKRYAALSGVQKPFASGGLTPYTQTDKPYLLIVGLTNGILSIFVLAMYSYSDFASYHYSHPLYILALCVVLWIWILRAWLNAYQEKICDDPVEFVLSDRFTYVLLAIVLMLFYIAKYATFK